MEEVVGGDRILHDAEVSGTFQEMLTLTARVLRANLLAIDALDGETLGPSQICSVISAMALAGAYLTLSSSFARNSTNAACTSSKGGAGRLEDDVFGFDLGVARGAC